MKTHCREGSALAVALVLLACAGIVLMAVFTHAMMASRYAAAVVTRARLAGAAQSVIEMYKGEIKRQFSLYMCKRDVHVGINCADALPWFEEVTSSRSLVSVGKGGCVATRPAVTNYNGCAVYLHAAKTTWGHGPGSIVLVATAESGGENVTIAEMARIVDPNPSRSQVFEYAYFVNNFGWMNGTSIIINGDMRANGDMSIAGSIVNGEIWAAPTAEVGADGEILLSYIRSGYSSVYPSIWARDYYWSNAGNSARPTSPTYSGANAPLWDGGFNAPSSTLTLNSSALSDTTSAAHRYLHEEADPLPMPFLSDLSDYREYAEALREDGGPATSTLKYRETTVNPATGALVAGAKKTITVCNYTADDDVNTQTANEMIKSAAAGPSGNAANGDQGALVLVGTASDPIEIDGPVIVASDVIIMGYVKGQGTIYSGRNIHVVGDIVYVNPPNWNHPDTNPEATAESNKSKDLVSLMAKGCVVVGNCTSSSWKSSIESYIDQSSDYTRAYYCDDNDTSIGYPSSQYKFNSNYTAQTLNQAELPKHYDCAYAVPVTWTKTETLRNGVVQSTSYSSASYSTPVLKPLDNPYTGTRNLTAETMNNLYTEQVTSSTSTRRVTKCTAYEVIGNSTTAHASGVNSYMSRSVSKPSSYYNLGARYYDTLCGDWVLNAVAQNGNSYVFGSGTGAGVARLNAVIYDNHGTFGQVGRSGANFTLNGSLICRDEALVGVSGLGKLIFNWDMRLKESGSEGVGNDKLSLPVGSGKPRTLIWQLVPPTWNPNFATGGGGV